MHKKVFKTFPYLKGKTKDHWSGYARHQLEKLGNSLQDILVSSDATHLLFELDSLGFFEVFLPELVLLKRVPQRKQQSSNAFHHSLTIVSKVPQFAILRWAAFLHDIGKSRYTIDFDGSISFRGHEYYGAIEAKNILKRYNIKNSKEICDLVRYHTHPLDYQRQPNWKMSTVKNFANKYGNLTLYLIDLAIADKIASSNQSEYIQPLYELRKMVEEIQA